MLRAGRPNQATRRRGGVLVWTVVAVPVLATCLACVGDVGYLWLTEAELEAAVSAGALAGAEVFGGSDENGSDKAEDSQSREPDGRENLAARQAAVRFAQANPVRGGRIDLDPNYVEDAPNGNASPAGNVVLGDFDGQNFDPQASRLRRPACRVEAVVAVGGLWNGLRGRRTLRATATAAFDRSSGSAKLVYVAAPGG